MNIAWKLMDDALLQRYRAMVLRGELAPDPAQALAAEKLGALANRLAQFSQPRRSGMLAQLTRKHRTASEGLYLFGPVDRGKTMLMDLFFDSVPLKQKHRVHFQEFMIEAHEAIDRARKEASGDPLRSAAGEIAKDAPLICIDELEVTDIADAMIVGRHGPELSHAHRPRSGRACRAL
jgi:cell division protein ZapE